jgi:hypothetical protein
MTSKIKVDNINKVSDDSNIIKKCGTTTTVGSGSGQTIVVDGATVTLGRCGGTVSLASGATQSGFGRTGTVDWCTTAKTSPFTAVSGDGFFVNTSGGAITVTLPSSPSAGDIVAFKDYAGTWATACKAVAICRNGSKINGGCFNTTLDTKAQSVTLIYVDGTKGWQDIHDSTAEVTGQSNFVAATGGNTTLTVGDYKTHIFTADGTLCVSQAGTASGQNFFDYLVVAGGGAAARDGSGAGGGGGGGFRLSNSTAGPGAVPAPTMSPLVAPAGLTLTTGAYPVTVGGGGPSTTPCLQGVNGSNSVFSTITSAGGGGGAAYPNGTGLPGGSGGGGGNGPTPSAVAGGNGNTPPVSPPQGQSGGTGAMTGPGSSPTHRGGGGGGGAGAAGSNMGPSSAGVGGDGSFLGDPYFGPTAPSYGTPGPVSSVRYFAGGGGASNQGGAPSQRGDGGAGGGGQGEAGGPGGNACGSNGTINTGGGSGGRYQGTITGTGGSGFVAIRYKFQ